VPATIPSVFSYPRHPQRFQATPWEQGMLGVPILQTEISSLECVLHHHQVVGTHGLFVGRIIATRGNEGSPPVNFQGALQT
jgi:flavin reductase